jgi:hypothetical protein
LGSINGNVPTPILATKLYIPTLRNSLVRRPRLVERLNDGLAAGRRLTLLSAPAGFGKTTLLGEWTAVCGRPVAWLTLDEADGDPARFLTYLVAALQTDAPDICAGRSARVLPAAVSRPAPVSPPGRRMGVASRGSMPVRRSGVESGDEYFRNRVMLRRHGVKLLTENIVGLPGETFAAAMRTLAVNRRLRPDVANASLFTPYPGLPLTEYAVARGFFDGDFDSLHGNCYH